jgi:hypothetical protein
MASSSASADRSPKVESDSRRGIEAASLILIYVPRKTGPSRRTQFLRRPFNPLKEVYFKRTVSSPPAPGVAHEYLHQIDLEFSKLHLPGEFLDPDGAGLTDYPSCIDSGGGDLSLRTLLQFNRDCRQIRWELLSPAYGAWIAR